MMMVDKTTAEGIIIPDSHSVKEVGYGPGNVLVEQSTAIANSATSSGGSKRVIPDKLVLNPWHHWGQRTEWQHDGPPDPERFLNCGPMSISMCIKYLTGVACPAQYIHDLIHNPGEIVGTTIEQIQNALSYFECGVHVHTVNSLDEYRNAVRTALSYGHPCIELQYFDHPGNDTLHYMVNIGYDPYNIYKSDPWVGAPVSWTWQRAWDMSYNIFVALQRKRCVK